jgi:peptidoglycan/xylan/chitin deacetylase (PgdA/CDA1 family)
MKIYASITFDDGKKSHLTKYYPILKKFGFPGSFYIITSQIGLAGRMDYQDLKKLFKAGNEIGSHTHTHPSLPKIDKTQLEKEFEESKKILAEFKPQTLSYPFGDYNQQVLEIASRYYKGARACGDISGKERDCGFNKKNNSAYKLKTLHLNNDFLRLIKNQKESFWLIFTVHEPPQVTFSYCLWFLKSHLPKPIDFFNLLKNLWLQNADKKEKREDLEEVCKFLKKNKIEVLTIKEGLKKFLAEE